MDPATIGLIAAGTIAAAGAIVTVAATGAATGATFVIGTTSVFVAATTAGIFFSQYLGG